MLTILSTAVLAQTLNPLVWWALVFFVIAIIAYLLGARGVAGMSAGVGRTLLFVFLVRASLFAILVLIKKTA